MSIRAGNAEVLVRPLYPETFPTGGLPHDFPGQMRLAETLGHKDREPDSPQPYWSVSHGEETARTKLVSVIINKDPRKQDHLSHIERYDGKDFLGVSVTQDEEMTEVYLNLRADGRLKHRNSVFTMNGWETDDYLTDLTFDQNAKNAQFTSTNDFFIGHGSYLQREGQFLIQALSKYTTLVKNF